MLAVLVRAQGGKDIAEACDNSSNCPNKVAEKQSGRGQKANSSLPGGLMMLRPLLPILLAMLGIAFGQGSPSFGSVSSAPQVGPLVSSGKPLPKLKIVPITLTLSNGPAEMDTVPGSPFTQGYCGADANVVTPTVCTAMATKGQTVTYQPRHSPYLWFMGFASNQPGCSGQVCSFTASGPASIVARFLPTSHLTIHLTSPENQAVTLTSDKFYTDGQEALQCHDQASGKSLGHVNIYCGAIQPAGSALMVTATYNTASGATLPLPSNRFPKDCVSTAPGKCVFHMTKVENKVSME